MSLRVAILGGLEIPIQAAFDQNQTYDPRARETIHAMGDSSIRKQVFAGSQTKVDTVLAGRGPIPPGLNGLDYSAELVLKCSAERSINSTSRFITISALRRGDTGYEPWGRARVAGHWVTTPVSMATDLATLTEVTDADYYQVLWFPEFTVLADGHGPVEEHDISGAQTGWSLRMMQV